MAMVAASIATRQMKKLNITKNVVDRSSQIFEGLNGIRRESPIISKIRGKGLMFGFDFPSEQHRIRFQREMAKNGIKTSLSTGRTVRFLPPLIISSPDADFFLEATRKSLREMSHVSSVDVERCIS